MHYEKIDKSERKRLHKKGAHSEDSGEEDKAEKSFEEEQDEIKTKNSELREIAKLYDEFLTLQEKRELYLEDCDRTDAEREEDKKRYEKLNYYQRQSSKI